MDVDDFLPMSALQHLSFCPRQCALIHIDRVWMDNGRTAEGTLLHERADLPGGESRPGVRVERALWLRSERLRLVGRADIVEITQGPDGARVVCPIEYKRGKRGEWIHDEVQLCAQAMALEEMLGCEITEAKIYYGQSRRRRTVLLTSALREHTAALARALYTMMARGVLPAAEPGPKCTHCSLQSACMPQVAASSGDYWRALTLSED
ncbi:MAG: CRISPR-associated protein Cas4 [Deltaproteobacteria bacterium]|nr:CRISPR-associated protein Cas4 [Deltaproteobacteria bacterium]